MPSFFGHLDFLKLGYISLNYTDTRATVTQVKKTLEKNEGGHVYKISVKFETKDQEMIQTSFRETVDAYESDYYQVGNLVPIRYSNWTPSICLGI